MEEATYQSIYESVWQSLMGRIVHRFARRETYQRSHRYVQGLLSKVQRRNSWQLAEVTGERTPDGMQQLLNTARWQEAGLRDDIQDYAVEVLGAGERIMVVDETGFLKKGVKSAGVKRQYSGTAGRIENCQIGVFLVYTTSQGATLIDRELYLPKEWAADVARCQEAGVPEDVIFQTKPQLAQQMLERAQHNKVRVDWVTGDTIYGGDRRLRLWLEEQQQAFVLGIKSDESLWVGLKQVRAAALAQQIPDDAWQRLSAGEGGKGLRWYDWAAVSLPRWGESPDRQHALLVRRSLDDPGDLAYYVVFAPATTTLLDWVRVAGQRWTVESCFEHAKDELGLDQYEVRHWTGWYRHITLVMLAQVFLNAVRISAQQAEKKAIAL